MSVSPALKEYIVEKYTDAKMGARPMKRAIQTEIEDTLAEAVLNGDISMGDHVYVYLTGEGEKQKIGVRVIEDEAE